GGGDRLRAGSGRGFCPGGRAPGRRGAAGWGTPGGTAGSPPRDPPANLRGSRTRVPPAAQRGWPGRAPRRLAPPPASRRYIPRGHGHHRNRGGNDQRHLTTSPPRADVRTTWLSRHAPHREHFMSKEQDLKRVLDCGIVAVVRSPDSQQLVEVARALADGGVTVVEITMSVPGALDVLRQVRQALGDRLLLGAG